MVQAWVCASSLVGAGSSPGVGRLGTAKWQRGKRGRSGEACASPRASECQHTRVETGRGGFLNPYGKRDAAL